MFIHLWQRTGKCEYFSFLISYRLRMKPTTRLQISLRCFLLRLKKESFSMQKQGNSRQTGSIRESTESFRPSSSRGRNDVRCDGHIENYVNHFMNSVRRTAGTFSCAIDCFLELWHHVSDENFCEMSNNQLIFLGNQVSQYYIHILHFLGPRSENDFHSIQEPVWDYLRDKCPSLAPMDCNAQFSEIFSANVFCNILDFESSKLISVYS